MTWHHHLHKKKTKAPRLYSFPTHRIAPMASSHGSKAVLHLALALVFVVQGTLGEITCERLDRSTCAFAVSSSGTRCVLEKRLKRSGLEEYYCRASEIEAEKLTDWVESDECVEACGLDRDTIGISSDSLLEPRFTQKLCSPECYNTCTNIVDLFFDLAAGEGVFLPKLCEAQATSARRVMAQIRSSGKAVTAPGPESISVACGPTQSALALANSPAQAPL